MLLQPKVLVTIAFAQALLAVVGSLYFSEIEGYLPCDLCWWQRIAIYPQIFILGVALWKEDWKVYRYSIPLLAGGWLVALYHNILYYNVNFFNNNTLPTPCNVAGPSCTERYLEYFGFVTIPLLAFLGLSLMLVCMLILRYKTKAGATA